MQADVQSISSASASARRSRLPDALALLALTAALGARIWGAWAMRCLTEPDPAVVGLMARHMAALREFPVFFYGQAYMGSLEPMASALMVRLLGSGGFAVNLGPVLFALAALAALWRWARDAAGPWGGLAAVLAALIGPAVGFQFQMAPRGGYMVALLVEILVLRYAARWAARLRAGERVGRGRFLALGLLAGIGLWNNLIVAPALLIAAGMLLWGMRGRLHRHGTALAAGLAGTAAGLLPWGLWNLRHGWASLEMAGSGREPLRHALRSTWDRFALLNDGSLGSWEHPGPVLAGAVLALAAAGVWTLWARRRDLSLRARCAGWGAAFFFVVFAAVFATSDFTRTPSARYWVPAVPALALLAAVACAAPGSRLRRAAAWMILLGLLAVQGGQAVTALRPYAQRAPACLAAYREIGAALEQAGADALRAPLRLYALNFALDERWPVSDGKQRFYEPILQGAELAERPAYASGFNGIETFLRRRGATWDSVPVAGRRILWNLRFPAPTAALPDDAVAALADAAGSDRRAILADGRLDTAWSPDPGAEAVLEWTLNWPHEVESVRLVFAHGMADEAFAFPRRIRIEIKADNDWRTILDNEPIIPLEESGGQVVFPAGLARPEFRIGQAGVEAVRVALLDTGNPAGRSLWRLAEARLHGPAGNDSPAPPEEPDAMAVAAAWIGQAGSDALVYAPRWLSNRLLADGTVPRDRLPGLAERVFPPPGGLPRGGGVDPARSALFFVDPRFADATRATLESQNIAWTREAAAGGLVLFQVEADSWDPDGLGLPPAVRWTGDELLAGHARERAGAALRLLRQGEGNEMRRKAWFREIVRWRPSALSALSSRMIREFDAGDAPGTPAPGVCRPSRPAPTVFANGACLEGVDIEPVRTESGGIVTVRLYWSVDDTFKPGPEVVFLHVLDAQGDIAAQADHRGPLELWGPEALRPPPGEIVCDTRTVTLPPGLPPGPLALAVGLYRPGLLPRRIRIESSQAPSVHRGAVIWPGAVRAAH